MDFDILDKDRLFPLVCTLLFASLLIGGTIYFAIQEPKIIVIENVIDFQNPYITRENQINTHDFLCVHDKEIVGIPIKAVLRGGELSNEITFQDNYTVKTTKAERFNWSSYKKKVIKVKIACEGYVADVQVIK